MLQTNAESYNINNDSSEVNYKKWKNKLELFTKKGYNIIILPERKKREGGRRLSGRRKYLPHAAGTTWIYIATNPKLTKCVGGV